MRVLDLFSGLGGWSAAFRDRGHRVTTLDVDPRFGADFVADIMEVRDLSDLGGHFDVILASPPCECFSLMTVGKNWNRDRTPKTERAAAALALAWHTFELVDRHRPRFYIIENPRGMLRKVGPRPPTATTWYCRWGMPYAKPTDLWTNIGSGMDMEWPKCHNRGLDHPYTPRGDKEHSVQGDLGRREIRARLLRGERVAGWKLTHSKGGRCVVRTGSFAKRMDIGAGPRSPALRALIPYRLSLAIALACEDGGQLPSLAAIEETERAMAAVSAASASKRSHKGRQHSA